MVRLLYSRERYSNFLLQGDQSPNIVPGDVNIVLQTKEHAHFKRKGDDLFYAAKIDLLTALAGGQFAVSHLDDRKLIVTILPGEVIKPGETKMITNEGMPHYKRPFDKGNLFVTFEVNFPPPNWVAENKLLMLEQILPPRQPVNAGSGHTEEVMLSTIDPMYANRNGASMDEDEEEERAGGGQPGVQCAQQ